MEMISKAIVAGSLEDILENNKKLTAIIDGSRGPGKSTDEELSREEQVKREYGDDASVVAPYQPNRKQRRAQEARRRGKVK